MFSKYFVSLNAYENHQGGGKKFISSFVIVPLFFLNMCSNITQHHVAEQCVLCTAISLSTIFTKMETVRDPVYRSHGGRFAALQPPEKCHERPKIVCGF